MKYARQQYMNKEVTHREYYGQFVTYAIKDMVARGIGMALLLGSRDEHFNDIPLKRWDALHVVGGNRTSLKAGGRR